MISGVKLLCRKILKVFVKKLSVEEQKYLCVLGLRIPYSTHSEPGPDCLKRL